MQVIDKLVIIKPEIAIWSGLKKLDPEDIGYDPPRELVSLGSKRVVPKKYLRKFETLKKKVDRLLSSHGIKILGGYAVSENMIETIRKKMGEFEDEFIDLRNEFIRDYWDYVEEQANNYPDWAGNLRSVGNELYPELGRKFHFGYKAYKLKPPQKDESEINDRFISDDEMETRAVSEIAETAAEILFRLSGKEDIKQASLKSVRGLKAKIRNIVDINRKLFGEAIGLIDFVLGEMPDKGAISGQSRKLLTSLLLVLNNPDPHREALVNGDYKNPEALLEAVDYDISGTSTEPEAETENEEDIPARNPERSEEFVWF